MPQPAKTHEDELTLTTDEITCCDCGQTDNFEYADNPDDFSCKHCGHMGCSGCTDLVEDGKIDRGAEGPEYLEPSSDRQLETLNAIPRLPTDVGKKPWDQKPSQSMKRLLQQAPQPPKMSSIASSGETEYVTEIAREVFNRIEAYELGSQTVHRLSETLSTLLKGLALDLGNPSPNYIVMEFMSVQRRAIVASFKDICLRNKKHVAPKSRPGKDISPMSTSQELQEGIRNLDLTDNPPNKTEGLGLPDIKEFKQLIFTSPGFFWLVNRLQGEISFSNEESHILDAIRDPIRSAFPSANSYVDKNLSEVASIIYTFYWDILAFLRAQEYELGDADAVVNAITLTGSATDAQVLTCRDYMAQTWPCTGHQTLKVLQGMLRKNGYHEEFSTSPGHLEISGTISDSSVVVRVAAINTELMVEIGEQLAWLGAALRSSPVDSGVIHCVPYLVGRTGSPSIRRRNIEFVVGYSYEGYKSENDETGREANGRCWYSLFTNPMIVRGYPIMKRCKTKIGMESSLEMLVALAGSRYVDTFKSKVFIKGFSTMLIPTRRIEKILIWHLFQSDNPTERISYLGYGIEHADIKIEDLKRYRHVLGWCSDAISIVGTKLANYDIEKSRLLHAHSGCAFERAEISGGQFVTGTAVFSLGNRERPVHITRSGFPIKLQWISSKYFVLWDEGEKRGWLVNGASVLLHILRSSLRYSQQKLRSVWSLDPNALEDVAGEPRSNSALEVLINEKNRDLKLFVDRTEVYDEETQGQHNSIVSTRSVRHYRLEDRIEHIYNILEKLIDHQTDVERRSGLDIKIRPRRQLEGWDFKDLATDGDPFFPRVAHLQTVGKGWVDFTRSLHAVTLFGRGFGELIQPQFGKGKVKPCPLWSTVPSNKYYLTACILDLQDIMERDGDPNSNPRRLCENVIWHMKQATFDLCPCNKGGMVKHHDPVQVLFPRHFLKNIKKKPQVDLETQGAVIFGHNMNLHWHWGDHGDPVKGDPQDQENIPDASNGSGPKSSPSSPIDNPSTSDPNNSIPETGSSSPMQTSESLRDPCGTAPKIQKRRFQDVLSSNFKNARISVPK